MLKRKAVGMVAETLASSGDVFTRDDDLELVGDAIPFGLKLYESLLDSAPTNKDLLIATCSNFTAVRGRLHRNRRAGARGSAASRRGRAPERARAQALPPREGLLRAGDGGAVPGHHAEAAGGPGGGARQGREEGCAAAVLDGGLVGLGNRPRRGPVRTSSSTCRRCGRSRSGPSRSTKRGAGDAARDVRLARQPAAGARRQSRTGADALHRAVELQKGLSPGPYVALALGVAVPAQDRAEYE